MGRQARRRFAPKGSAFRGDDDTAAQLTANVGSVLRRRVELFLGHRHCLRLRGNRRGPPPHFAAGRANPAATLDSLINLASLASTRAKKQRTAIAFGGELRAAN